MLLQVICLHENVTFNWVKGHAGHTENERCDELALLALKGNDLLVDIGYQASFQEIESVDVSLSSGNLKNVKVQEEGDSCRKCAAKVVKKQTKKKVVKPGQTYYFEYYLLCPGCKTMYMVEEAKREIGSQGKSLFS